MKHKNYIMVQTITPIEIMPNPYHQNSIKPYKIMATELGSMTKGKVNSESKVSDMFNCMRYFLIFGKVIGVVPISGLFKGNLDELKFGRWSLTSIITKAIIFILTLNMGVAVLGYLKTGGKDATQLAKNAAASVCYGIGLYVYIFIYRNAEGLIRLLRKWREIQLSRNQEEWDLKLGFKINVIAGAVLTSAITENAVSHLLLFPLNEYVENPLEYYYENSHKQWAEMIPYNPAVAIAVFLCNKWALYAWNFGDILLILISRTIYGRFRGFMEALKEQLSIREKVEKTWWHNAIEDHSKLCKLTDEFADLLSPLIFTSFVVNIYFICIQLHLFLTPSGNSTFLKSLYGSWSFLHLLARTFAVALAAAKINDYATHFKHLLNTCPEDTYTHEVERAERKLNNYPTAFHGLGTFYITRPFIMSVISVIFTFEIVLLTTPQMMISTPK